MQRKASAVWVGGLKSGSGTVSTESGALSETPYSFPTRFESVPGCNPEELIGAAHAACFSMALSGQLEKEGLKADTVQTTATVTLEKNAQGWSVTEISLETRAKIPTASLEIFQMAAEEAKKGCPISRLLRVPVTLKAILEEGEESLSA